jgi:hypothetical protein
MSKTRGGGGSPESTYGGHRLPEQRYSRRQPAAGGSGGGAVVAHQQQRGCLEMRCISTTHRHRPATDPPPCGTWRLGGRRPRTVAARPPGVVHISALRGPQPIDVLHRRARRCAIAAARSSRHHILFIFSYVEVLIDGTSPPPAYPMPPPLPLFSGPSS